MPDLEPLARPLAPDPDEPLPTTKRREFLERTRMIWFPVGVLFALLAFVVAPPIAEHHASLDVDRGSVAFQEESSAEEVLAMFVLPTWLVSLVLAGGLEVSRPVRTDPVVDARIARYVRVFSFVVAGAAMLLTLNALRGDEHRFVVDVSPTDIRTFSLILMVPLIIVGVFATLGILGRRGTRGEQRLYLILTFGATTLLLVLASALREGVALDARVLIPVPLVASVAFGGFRVLHPCARFREERARRVAVPTRPTTAPSFAPYAGR